jgi:hypothetical protein
VDRRTGTGTYRPYRAQPCDLAGVEGRDVPICVPAFGLGETAHLGSTLPRVRPRHAPQPLQLQPRELEEGEVCVVYRVVLTDDREDPAFVESFKSREARGLPPRSWTVEGPNPELAAGISAYLERQAAARTAQKALDRGAGFGEYVAEVRLEPAQGLEIAVWGPRGHLTIWGDPLTLARYAVDILPIAPREGN